MDASNEDARTTIESARVHTATSSIEGDSLLFATLNLPEVTSNGEVEGPRDHAGRAQVETKSSNASNAAGQGDAGAHCLLAPAEPNRPRITDPSNDC
jgi:hypothetical protein